MYSINSAQAPKCSASYTVKSGDRIQSVLLLYSGGLDTSCMIPWIRENFNCDVYALTLNIGQPSDNIEQIKQKAYTLGAREHFTIDARQRLVERYCFQAVKSNAVVGRNGHPICSSLTRPLIAQIATTISKEKGIAVIAHGASGMSNDGVRFDTSLLALNPKVRVLAPVRMWSMTREKEIDFAMARGIPVEASHEKPFSIDENIWGIEYESGSLMNLSEPFPNNSVLRITNCEEAVDQAEEIKLTFQKGIPIALNDEQLPAVKLVENLNRIGNRHAIGRFDFLEDRATGIKAREIHDCPAATILIAAHLDIEQACLSPDCLEIKRIVDMKWSSMMLFGKAFDPAIIAINSFTDSLSETVSGTVVSRLYKGSIRVVSRQYPFSLDQHTLIKSGFLPNGLNQEASASYTEVASLPLRAHYSHSVSRE